MSSFILDCETPETTLTSICRAYRCEAKVIISALEKIDLEAVYGSTTRPAATPDEFLFDCVVNELGEPELPDEICWFHFTRTTSACSFKEGILPLGDVLPKVWDTLIDIASSPSEKGNLRHLRESGVPDFQYGLKAPNSFHWGPYGYLVREVADHARNLSQHDYLAMPEIIEDICNGYEERFGASLIERFRRELRPCAVKFAMPAGDRGLDTLKVALSYLYSVIKREEPDSSCITCFDGEGIAVPPQRILSVTFVEPTITSGGEK